MQGLFHGPRLRELDAAHGGSVVEAQTAVVLSGSRWPSGLLADVAAVRASDFVLRSGCLDESLDLLVTARRP